MKLKVVLVDAGSRKFGPGGLFHTLRNMGPSLAIARAMERRYPEGLQILDFGVEWLSSIESTICNPKPAIPCAYQDARKP